ncbi:MAG: hypothetical protein F4210_08805 [Holophagales bacterium]|nr:hypothetical protein [Holophagales bacterium]MYF95595.1 hypothetical protein [Holophagales bacterium]
MQFFHRRGRRVEQSPASPPVGLHAARKLVEHLEDAGILVAGKESMPTWDGRRPSFEAARFPEVRGLDPARDDSSNPSRNPSMSMRGGDWPRPPRARRRGT